MACGHHLMHYTAQCQPPKDELQCKAQLQKRFIDDTCADCHAEVQRQMQCAAYDYHRAQVAEQYREASKAGDEELMREIEWEMMMNVNRAREQNFKAGSSKTKGGDVLWK